MGSVGSNIRSASASPLGPPLALARVSKSEEDIVSSGRVLRPSAIASLAGVCLICFFALAGAIHHRAQQEAGNTKPTHYDCDADGQDECGRYSGGGCSNPSVCMFSWHFGDVMFGHSCRCRILAAQPERTPKTLTKKDHPLLPSPAVRTDYDCDGDGHDECGRYAYGQGGWNCRSPHLCHFSWRFGDVLLDHSCRCQGLVSKFNQSLAVMPKRNHTSMSRAIVVPAAQRAAHRNVAFLGGSQVAQ